MIKNGIIGYLSGYKIYKKSHPLHNVSTVRVLYNVYCASYLRIYQTGVILVFFFQSQNEAASTIHNSYIVSQIKLSLS